MKINMKLVMMMFLITVMSIFIYAEDNITLENQTFNIIEAGINGTNTSFTTYDYLNTQLSVNFTSNNTNLNNDNIWYQWFFNGVDVLKGWGQNVINFFFTKDDVGINTIQVNASNTENGTNNVWSNTLSWTINVTEPTKEPTELLPITETEVFDSINIYCRHEFTGHNWMYDIDVKTYNGTAYNWYSVNNGVPTMEEWSAFDLTSYVDNLNYSIRCRTYNEYYNYSNYIQVDNINKKSQNQLKLFRPIYSTIFLGQMVNFQTECDMSKNSKYKIIYHFADGNADVTYDKLLDYSNTTIYPSINKSIFMYATQFENEGTQRASIGCIIEKKTSESWEFPSCKEGQSTCTIQTTYEFEVKK